MATEVRVQSLRSHCRSPQMKTPPRALNQTAWEERYANFSALHEVCTAFNVSAIRQRTCMRVGPRLQG